MMQSGACFLFLLVFFLTFDGVSPLAIFREFVIKTYDDYDLYTIHFYNSGEEQSKGKTVMIRTPYGATTHSTYCRHLIEHGHAKHVLLQDLRGTHKSTGMFYFFNDTSLDSLSTIHWIKSQNFYNGEIVTSGASALAISQYMDPLYCRGPDAVSAQCMLAGTGNMYDFIFPGGAFREGDVKSWIGGVAGTLGMIIVDFLLMHEQYDDFWHGTELSTFASGAVTWPSIHMGGWYDAFAAGLVESHGLYREQEPERTYLVMSTGGHCQGKSAISFPNASFMIDEGVRCPMFFDNPHPSGVGEFVQLYVMGPDSIPYGSKGGNYWVGFPDWPAFVEKNLYLSSSNSLVFDCPDAATFSRNNLTMRFVYDPTDPSPTLGGNNLPGEGMPCGCQDMRKAEEREDNLVWTSDVFADPVAVVGQLSATLFVSSDRKDTDFMVRLTDVYPDGRSMLIQDGALRMRHRLGKQSKPVLMTPGQVYQVEIDLHHVAYIVNPGHRLRVGVTSSNYPRFSVNPNNGFTVLEAGPLLVADNVVRVGRGGCSRVSLPVVSLEVLEKHQF